MIGSRAFPLSRKCDKCGSAMVVKVRTAPKRPILEWYYYCERCNLREVFMEEPLEDD